MNKMNLVICWTLCFGITRVRRTGIAPDHFLTRRARVFVSSPSDWCLWWWRGRWEPVRPSCVFWPSARRPPVWRPITKTLNDITTSFHFTRRTRDLCRNNGLTLCTFSSISVQQDKTNRIKSSKWETDGTQSLEHMKCQQIRERERAWGLNEVMNSIFRSRLQYKRSVSHTRGYLWNNQTTIKHLLW